MNTALLAQQLSHDDFKRVHHILKNHALATGSLAYRCACDSMISIRKRIPSSGSAQEVYADFFRTLDQQQPIDPELAVLHEAYKNCYQLLLQTRLYAEPWLLLKMEIAHLQRRKIGDFQQIATVILKTLKQEKIDLNYHCNTFITTLANLEEALKQHSAASNLIKEAAILHKTKSVSSPYSSPSGSPLIEIKRLYIRVEQ